MNPNDLSRKIQDAAQALTEAILSESQAQAYQSAAAALNADPDAAALEKRFMDFYTDLITRQQKGEQLEQQEVQKFHVMRAEYNNHLLVAARNAALGAFKILLAEAGEGIRLQICMDFTELAKPA